MKKIILFLVTISLFSCKVQDNKQFSLEALEAPISSVTGDEITLKELIENHKEKTTIIDVWASWCGDCIRGLPELKKIQKEHPEVNYVFISLDQNKNAWKNGIKRYRIKGNHYYVDGGWKSIFAKNIDLDWIPRYIVLDKNGNVILYRAIHANDSKILKILKN